MFGKNKYKPTPEELEAWRAKQEIKRNALNAINEAFATGADYNYLIGLIEMAHIAEILTKQERDLAREQAEKKK